MPPASPAELITRRVHRRQQSARHPGHWGRRFGLALAAVLSLAAAILLLLAGSAYTQLTQNLPPIALLDALLGPDGHLRAPSQILSRDGEVLLFEYRNPNAQGANYLALEQIPPDLINAILAQSDPGFREHSGLGGANWRDPTPATLAERLVVELLLYNEPESARRALRMRLLAAQATAEFGRDQVLEWYLNHADFGHLSFGADAAARVYFGKLASELTLAESALLAAAADAPALNPLDAPALALERQGRVLQAMVAQGYLNQEQALSANTVPLALLPPHAPAAPHSAEFFGLVLEQLAEHFPPGRVRRGGLKIITTLDAALQEEIACTAAVQIARLTGNLPLNSLAGVDCETARLLPTFNSDAIQAGATLAADVIVIDSASGQILALLGNPKLSHPPGTAVSPFVYLTAFTRGFGPASLVWDVPASLPPGLEGYTNATGEFHGPLSIRAALANDYLVPALQILAQVGPANAWRTATQAGLLELAAETGYQPLVGQSEVSLLNLVQAYSVFSNQGLLSGQPQADGRLMPTAILTVNDPDGRILLDWRAPTTRALTTAPLAYLVTDILSDVLAREASLGRPNPLETGRPAAAKLGQTASGQHTWTLGYSPQRTVGVWLGPEADTLNRALEPLAAAGLWNAVFRRAHASLEPLAFNEPVGLNRVAVCVPSGLLPTADCPQVVQELFIPGNEPLFADNLYQGVQINRQTGRLATIFTPPELVETRVYLSVPPQALEWARSAGISLAPEDYDAIFTSTGSSTAAIQSPSIFSYVGGQVPVLGRADGEDFAYYRVQVGEGLNPRQWLQLGEDRTTPVTDGELAVWDTSGLNGLYALQLLVVTTDNSIQTANLQVTVDNTPPELQILFPTAGAQFTYPAERELTFQARAEDAIALARVEFLVDDRPVLSLSTAPFAVVWSGSPGTHTLTVRAFDQAGNMSELSLEFTLQR